MVVTPGPRNWLRWVLPKCGATICDGSAVAGLTVLVGSTGLAKEAGSNQAWPPTELLVGGDEVGVLGLAVGVEDVGVGADREGGSADVAELPIQLEAAEDGAGDSVAGKHLSPAEGQVIDAPELEVVGAVVAGCGPVLLPVAGIAEGRTGASCAGTIFGEGEGMRPGVDDAELRETAGVAGELGLKAVVVRAADRAVHGDAGGVVAGGAGGDRGAVLLVEKLVGGKVAGVRTQPMGVEHRRWVVLAIGHAGGGAIRQRRGVQGVVGELADRLGADVTDIHDELTTEIVLDEKVPALDVAAMNDGGNGVCGGGDGQRDEAAGDAGRDQRRDTDRERQRVVVRIDRNGVGSSADVGGDENHGVGVAEEAQVLRVRGDAEAGTDDEFVVDTVDGSDTGNDLAPAYIDAGAFCVTAEAADDDVGTLREVGIETEDAGLIAVGNWVVLVPGTIGEGELGSDIPLVLRVDPGLGPTDGIGVEELIALGDGGADAIVGQTEEHVGECLIRVDAAGVGGHAAEEGEGAARIDVGLEVVEIEVVPGAAGLHGVLTQGPAHVYIGGELVVAEEKGICAVGVSEAGELGTAGRREGGLADVVDSESVRSGDAEFVGAVVAGGDVDGGLRAGDLAGVSGVGVDEEMRGDDVAHAESDVLDASCRGPGLATVEGSASSGSELLGVGDGEGLDGVTTEDAGVLGGDVGDLGVVGIAVIGERSATGIVVVQLVRVVGIGDCCRDGLQKSEHGLGCDGLTGGGDAVAAVLGLEGRAGSGGEIGAGAAGLRICEERKATRDGGEVAVEHGDRGHALEPGDQLAAGGALEGFEEEELFLAGQYPGQIDRASDREAELVEDVLGNLAGVGGVGAGVGVEELVVLPRTAVELAGAGLDADVNGRATRDALLGVERVGHDVDALDGVRGRDVGDQVSQPAVVVDRTVDAGRVRVVRDTIHVDRHGARGIGGGRVLFADGRRAGQKGVERLIVAALRGGDRQLRDLGLGDLVVDLRGLGLEHGSRRADGDLRGDGCGLERDIDARLAVDLNRNISLQVAGEAAGSGQRDGVASR